MKVKILTVFTLALAFFLSACGGKSDADLQKAASEKLTAEKVTGVTVAVKDGVATLSGQVDDITVKNRAATGVKGVEGIKSVTDNTTLKPLPPPPIEAEQSDPEIKTKVEEGIKKLGLPGITVAVNDAKVTLNGTVPKDRLAEVIKAAMEADIKGIDNKLVVK